MAVTARMRICRPFETVEPGDPVIRTDVHFWYLRLRRCYRKHRDRTAAPFVVLCRRSRDLPVDAGPGNIGEMCR